MLLSLHSLLKQQPAYTGQVVTCCQSLKEHSLGQGVGLVTQCRAVLRVGFLVAVQTHSGQKLLENLFSYIQVTQSDAKKKKKKKTPRQYLSRLSAAKHVLCFVGVRARYVGLE